MSVTSQQVNKSATSQPVRTAPGVTSHVRGFAGNHILMRKQNKSEGSPRNVDESAQRSQSEITRHFLQRKCACGTGQGGTCEECKKPEAGQLQRNVQTKLAVSKPGDRYEQEADRVADQVLAAPAHSAVSGAPPQIHRYTGQATGQAETAPDSVDHVLAGPGRPLEPVLRQDMEQRFGHDFSGVRLHTDRNATESARQVGAKAYTVGQHTVFDSGRFSPHTHEGRHLVAHELAHVVQQSHGADVGPIQREPGSESSMAPPFKRSLGMRAPYQLELGDPRTDSSVHASVYALLPRIVGLSTAWFSQKYPKMDDALYKRIVELGLTVGWQVPWMVLSHEYGHYRVGEHYGWDPKVSILSWYSGVTEKQNKTKAALAPDTEKNESSVAGVNQERLNSMRLFVQWALNNSIDPHEAFAFLATRTNMAFYAARSSVGGGTGPQDDLRQYQSRTGVSTEKILMLAGAADLLSASTWGAFIPMFTKFLAKGQRRFEVPSFRLGGVRTTLPNFNVLLTNKGPIIGAQAVVGIDRNMPVEITIETGIDQFALGLGAKVHGIPLAGRLTASPFLRATFDNTPGLSVVGTDLRYDFSGRLSITATLEYRRNDLLAEPTGKENTNLGGGVSIGLSLP